MRIRKPARCWFQDRDGSYYRNCPLIMAEQNEAAAWQPLIRKALLAEWYETFSRGVQRKDELAAGDVAVGEPASFRESYPQNPGLWVLDEDGPSLDRVPVDRSWDWEWDVSRGIPDIRGRASAGLPMNTAKRQEP